MSKNRIALTILELGIPFILTLVFLILKLTGIILWSWLWIFFPILLPFTLYFCSFFFLLLFLIILSIVVGGTREDLGNNLGEDF